MYTNKASLEYNKLTPLVLKEYSLDYNKVNSLKLAYIDIYKYKNILKLDEVYLRLLRLKRYRSIR